MNICLSNTKFVSRNKNKLQPFDFVFYKEMTSRNKPPSVEPTMFHINLQRTCIASNHQVDIILSPKGAASDFVAHKKRKSKRLADQRPQEFKDQIRYDVNQ